MFVRAKAKKKTWIALQCFYRFLLMAMLARLKHSLAEWHFKNETGGSFYSGKLYSTIWTFIHARLDWELRRELKARHSIFVRTQGKAAGTKVSTEAAVNLQ